MAQTYAHTAATCLASLVILMTPWGAAFAVDALPRMCGVQQLGWSGLKEDKISLDDGTVISTSDGLLFVSSQGKAGAKYSRNARVYRDPEGAVHVIDGVNHVVIGNLKEDWPEIANKRGIVMPNCLRTMLANMELTLTKAGLKTTKALKYSKPTDAQLKAIGCYAR